MRCSFRPRRSPRSKCRYGSIVWPFPPFWRGDATNARTKFTDLVRIHRNETFYLERRRCVMQWAPGTVPSYRHDTPPGLTYGPAILRKFAGFIWKFPPYNLFPTYCRGRFSGVPMVHQPVGPPAVTHLWARPSRYVAIPLTPRVAIPARPTPNRRLPLRHSTKH